MASLSSAAQSGRDAVCNLSLWSNTTVTDFLNLPAVILPPPFYETWELLSHLTNDKVNYPERIKVIGYSHCFFAVSYWSENNLGNKVKLPRKKNAAGVDRKEIKENDMSNISFALKYITARTKTIKLFMGSLVTI